MKQPLAGVRERYNMVPIQIKAVIWFTIGNVILKGISFFTSPLFARLLSTYEYGRLTLFQSYEQIILIFGTWELGLGPYQKGLFKYKTEKSKFTSYLIAYSNIITIILFCLVVLFWKPFMTFTGMDTPCIIVLFIYIYTQTAFQCWITRSRVDFAYRKLTILNVSLAVLQIVFPLIAVLVLRRDASIKFTFTLFPAIIVNIVIMIMDFKPAELLIKGRENYREYAHYLTSFTLPLVLHSLSYYILSQSDRIMIGKMTGEEKAGIYGVAYTIAMVVMLVQNSLTQVLSPWMYKKLENKQYSIIKKTLLSVVVFVGIIYILFNLLAPEVVLIMYPDSYHEGIWCIPPIVSGIFFMFLYSLFVNVETYFERTKYIAIISSISAALNIVLNYIGIGYFGYIACAYTTLICYIFFSVGHYLVMNRITKINKISLFNGKIILMFGVLVLLIILSCLLIYQYRMVRLIIALCIILGILASYKKISGMIIKILKA